MKQHLQNPFSKHLSNRTTFKIRKFFSSYILIGYFITSFVHINMYSTSIKIYNHEYNK